MWKGLGHSLAADRTLSVCRSLGSIPSTKTTEQKKKNASQNISNNKEITKNIVNENDFFLATSLGLFQASVDFLPCRSLPLACSLQDGACLLVYC